MKTVPLVTVLALAPALAAAQQPFNWQGKLAAGKTIEVITTNGHVEASGVSGGGIQVTATKRAGRHGDPDDVDIKVVEHDGGVTICAVYPSPRGDRPNECRPGGRGRNETRNNDVEVDFDVKVPAGVKFVGRSVNGSVDVESLSSDAEAYTVNGDVRVTATGVVEANTVNGSIVATMGRGDWSDGLAFETVNGSVTLTMPQDLSADLEMETVNGSIESDFPITVTGKVNPQQLRGRVGQGGRDLDIKTVNGSIRLRRRT
jgi:hypothetical protein